MLASFGTGVLIGKRTDIANSTPEPFSVLQEVDFDFSFETKPLFGLNQFAVFIARGEAKWTGKAKSGTISGLIFNNIFFGQNLTPGQTALAASEAHTVPTTSPFTITATNSATFVEDEGATYSGNPGLPLLYVTTTPATIGEYEQAAGTYTFSSSDSGAKIFLNYLYTTTTGENIVINNVILGTTPTFSAVFRNRDPKTGLFSTLVLNSCTSTKLTLSSKTSDYEIPEFDFQVLDDGTGVIGIQSFGDVS